MIWLQMDSDGNIINLQPPSLSPEYIGEGNLKPKQFGATSIAAGALDAEVSVAPLADNAALREDLEIRIKTASQNQSQIQHSYGRPHEILLGCVCDQSL